MSFGSELRRIRVGVGLSQKQLAEAAGITRPLLSHIELGIRPPQHEPDDDCLIRLADCLKLKGAERQRFLDLGYIAHLPVVARPRFEALEQRLGNAESLANLLKRQVQDLLSRLKALEK